ncbi:Carbamoyltransferase HypF [bacterium HR16]|nr:Carbamoyltransferase HypF [bacterium HR16]
MDRVVVAEALKPPRASDKRVRLVIRGAVQGVGFRPFIYRLATELGLKGWVLNSAQGVFIEVEGEPEALQQFVRRIETDKPPRAFIQSLEQTVLDPVGYTAFEIRHSEESGEKSALILPDIATCPDCLRELFDPADRRYLYPFTNCTNCGPRYSIIEALPYDRPNTTMKAFIMCPLCREEYENPLDRRFHAQPNACPECGPHLELWDQKGVCLAKHHEALLQAGEAMREGRIVAVKGLGGFHLMVDARNDPAVRRLRERKRREEKPFALMYPSLQMVKAHCEVNEVEERVLRSPESPIVLLRRKEPEAVAPSVAPSNPYLGVMLPYTPLHHLLMCELGFPVVATSGNLSDEPICTDEHEALHRLADIADLFLVHNRPIARHVDDSVVRVLLGRELVLRRARGYAPLPVLVKEPLPPLLAVGAHLKNTVALSVGRQVFLSQHIGDLETPQALQAFRRVIADVRELWEHQPQAVACDMHPDYLSTQAAHGMDLPVIDVQHHVAHVLSCMAENELEPPVLGVSWDGTGYGTDGTIWGGEFLILREQGWERFAHLRPFRLPGGDRAIKEPRRSALGVLYELFGDDAFDLLAHVFTEGERRLLRQMLRQGVNAPITTSAGRLFDAVASLAGLRQVVRFEGQAAMELEFLTHDVHTDEVYPFSFSEGSFPRTLDWSPMVRAILEDARTGISASLVAARFHNTLVEMMVTVARAAGIERVALSGGCFQNAYLTERAVRRLGEEGFRPYWHQRVPPNDGGIALGQIVGAARG